MNGYRKGDEVIYITHIQGYKKPVLAIGNGCVIHKIASFDSEEDAEYFCKLLGRWLGLVEEVKNE